PLDARVAVEHAVLLTELFVKVPHAEIEILLAVQTHDLLGDRPRHAFRTGPPSATVQQAVKTTVPVALQDPPQMPRTVTQDAHRLPKHDLLAHRPQDNLLYFHRPLPGSLRIANH